MNVIMHNLLALHVSNRFGYTSGGTPLRPVAKAVLLETTTAHCKNQPASKKESYTNSRITRSLATKWPTTHYKSATKVVQQPQIVSSTFEVRPNFEHSLSRLLACNYKDCSCVHADLQYWLSSSILCSTYMRTQPSWIILRLICMVRLRSWFVLCIND